jgi:hypothetical protein
LVRLDTAVFLTDAISLYGRMGFVEIAPYTDIPSGAAPTSLFMEWRPRRDWLKKTVLLLRRPSARLRGARDEQGRLCAVNGNCSSTPRHLEYLFNGILGTEL